MPNGHDHDLAGGVLATAITSRKNVFFIGPYGKRVSFASQQRRALNIVWALTESQYWPRDRVPRVAVVGGGIAGLMAAAALIMRHCSVRLYEKQRRVLKLQEEADHRTVHPSVNFWPHETLRATTVLPFFDWFPGTAQSIIGLMKEEWAHFSRELAEKEVETEVIDFTWDETLRQVALVLADGTEQHADLVLVAAGFGKEKDLGDPAQIPYWVDDNIDRIRDREGKQYLVSGTGDGGLIDVLRLVYPRFMVDELALEYLEMIDSAELRAEVNMIENVASDMTDADDRALYFRQAYCQLANSMSQRAKELFPPLANSRLPVELVGEFAEPFEIRSAPIHKLIIAHALNNNDIHFTKGRLSRKGGTFYLKPHGKRSRALSRDLIIVRHGTDVPAKHILGEPEAENLRIRQEAFGDFLGIGEPPGDFFDRPDLYPTRDPNCIRFADRRHALTDKFLGERHGYYAELMYREGEAPYFEVRPLPRRETRREIRPLPRGTTDLFGIPFVIRPLPVQPASNLVRHRP